METGYKPGREMDLEENPIGKSDQREERIGTGKRAINSLGRIDPATAYELVMRLRAEEEMWRER